MEKKLLTPALLAGLSSGLSDFSAAQMSYGSDTYSRPGTGGRSKKEKAKRKQAKVARKRNKQRKKKK